MTKTSELAELMFAEYKKSPARLKNRREQLNLTQPELSKRSGVYRESIVKSEVGIKKPDGTRRIYRHGAENMCKIAAALGTTPAYLEYGSISISSFDEDLIALVNRIQKLHFKHRKSIISQCNNLMLD